MMSLNPGVTGREVGNQTGMRLVCWHEPIYMKLHCFTTSHSPNRKRPTLVTRTSPLIVLIMAVHMILPVLPSLFPTLSVSFFLPAPQPATALAPQRISQKAAAMPTGIHRKSLYPQNLGSYGLTATSMQASSLGDGKDVSTIRTWVRREVRG